MKFKTVIFDFDSTLVTIEGINELARLKGNYREVAALTQQTMDGNIPFNQVFYRRLQLINPALEDLEAIADLYLTHITPGAQTLIQTLLQQKIEIFCITGGYLQAIAKTAAILGLDSDHVFAISLAPDQQGFYTKVAANELLVNHDGKMQMIQKLKPKRKIAFVGDGHTDAQTIPVVDRFIGYAGVTQSHRLESVTPFVSFDLSLNSVIKYLD